MQARGRPLLPYSPWFRVQIPPDRNGAFLLCGVNHYAFQSLEVPISPRNTQVFQTVGDADLIDEWFFCATGSSGGGYPAPSHPPFSSEALCPVPLTAAPTPAPPLDPSQHRRCLTMTTCFETSVLWTFLGTWPSHFLSPWSLAAATGGYPAVGFSAAAPPDAAAPAAAPPVFTAPRPPYHSARAARPSPPAPCSR